MPADTATALRKAGWQRYDRASGSAEPEFGCVRRRKSSRQPGCYSKGPKKGKLPDMINLEPVLVIGA
jgi:hypothetical protein